ncbi:UNVERIFIED_CONTAM: Retrovirus-related Pol polyprotein from transposon TNT 1-94 [Sesamum radiatum]|uniref:Retrovirus-related Pol polyprotein from transposon TNT 1-94 n=1 Tax=Sesamum radiatum TaxID=300843 RepID=A0AAW2VM56_SESRA
MVPELQKQFEDMEAYDIIIQLKAMFGYANFVVNHHMNSLDKTVHELLGMLKTAEKSIKGEPQKNVLMGLKRTRELGKGEVDLRFGNGARVAALAIGTYVLSLPSGFTLELNNCYYVPSVNRNLIFVSTLDSEARGGYSYFITFTDDLSRYGCVYLMKHKSEVFEKFKEFQNEVQNQLGKTIKSLRSDRGGEYLSQEFIDHLKSCGILEQRTPTGTPQLNGVSERRNRTLLEMVRSMMSLVDLSISFWGYALLTAAHILNRTPSKAVENTLYEIWPQITSPVGAQEVVSTSVEQTTDVVKPIRRTSRKSNPPKRNPLEGYLINDGYDVFLFDMDTTYKAAMASTDSEKWLIAMKSEMESMYDNKVWNLVDLPKGTRPIECKWIYKIKTDMDGKIVVYKARLVAKGFKQIHGIDYDETFSPVAMLKSIRILLAIASYFDYEIWQMDVKTAFLNGYLEEEVYMTQPKGFVNPQSPKKVCKLQRSIYGLKQASRSWNLRFDEAIKEFGFLRNPEEACVYKKLSGSNIVFLVLIKDYFLTYGGEYKLCVKGYTDASFQTDKDDYRSQSGYVFILNGGVISWKSSKQNMVEDSTTEAEYIAAAEAAKEAVWIKNFIF